jgi:predicted transcriptional regulator of viral defense system
MGRRFVRPADVAAALNTDPDTAAKKLARWSAEGWVRRVRRGLYIGVPVDATNPGAWSEDALIVATEVWSPCYFTGWTAAHHWALTEQVFRTTVLRTSARVRSSTARLLDHDYRVGHVAVDALNWGLRAEWRDEIRLSFADPARTVVEMLDAPSIGGGVRHVAEVLVAYLDDYDDALLIESGDRLGNGAVFKRLGHLLDVLELEKPKLREACQQRITAGVSALDPDGPPGGSRDPRWGLRKNVTVVQEGAS